MALCTADFETGTVGNNIATTDSGGYTPFDTVSVGASATFRYANDQVAHGTKSAKQILTASPSASYLGWSTQLGTLTDHYGRMYLRFAQNFGTDPIIECVSSAAQSLRILLNGTNSIVIRDQADVTQASGTAQLLINTWARIEWHVIHSTTVGQVIVRIYQSMDSATITETISTAASINNLASCNDIRLGVDGNNTGWSVWFDELMAGATDWPGPKVDVIPYRAHRMPLGV